MRKAHKYEQILYAEWLAGHDIGCIALQARAQPGASRGGHRPAPSGRQLVRRTEGHASARPSCRRQSAPASSRRGRWSRDLLDKLATGNIQDEIEARRRDEALQVDHDEGHGPAAERSRRPQVGDGGARNHGKDVDVFDKRGVPQDIRREISDLMRVEARPATNGARPKLRPGDPGRASRIWSAVKTAAGFRYSLQGWHSPAERSDCLIEAQEVSCRNHRRDDGGAASGHRIELVHATSSKASCGVAGEGDSHLKNSSNPQAVLQPDAPSASTLLARSVRTNGFRSGLPREAAAAFERRASPCFSERVPATARPHRTPAPATSWCGIFRGASAGGDSWALFLRVAVADVLLCSLNFAPDGDRRRSRPWIAGGATARTGRRAAVDGADQRLPELEDGGVAWSEPVACDRYGSATCNRARRGAALRRWWGLRKLVVVLGRHRTSGVGIGDSDVSSGSGCASGCDGGEFGTRMDREAERLDGPERHASHPRTLRP